MVPSLNFVNNNEQRCQEVENSNKNIQAKSEQLWTWTARRDVVQTVLDSWVSEGGEEATLEILLLALNYPDFKDVKMRVERMVHLAS